MSLNRVLLTVGALACLPLVMGNREPEAGKNVWMLSRVLRSGITGVKIDALGSRLRLLRDDSQAAAESYLLARLGKTGRWERLSDDHPSIQILRLGDGYYTLQVRRVQSGIVYQRVPDEIRFRIRRDTDKVLEELVRCLTSGDEQEEKRAVEFLGPYLTRYVEQLDARVADNDRAVFLLSAARLRAKERPSAGPTPRPDDVMRVENGYQIWDFSEHPDLNRWFVKQTLLPDNSLADVRSLAFDGERLWFTHAGGVGSLGARLDDLKLYGGEHGLPAFASDVCPALEGAIYVGTDQGLAVYDPDRDRFARVPNDGRDPPFIRAMEVDASGRLWMLNSRMGGGVLTYDGRQWLDHKNLLTIYGMTRDAAGAIWLGGQAHYKHAHWNLIFPSSLLQQRPMVSTIHDTYPFADYLGRLFVHVSRFPPLIQYEWPGADGEAKELQSYEQWHVWDRVNREIWIDREGTLVNDTRASDPLLADKEKWRIPAPPRENIYWKSICAVEKDRIYLGTNAGLHVFDGATWLRVRPAPKKPVIEQPSWPGWRLRQSMSSVFCRPITAKRIEITKPYLGGQPPRGRFYEIVKRDFESQLVEETDDGRKQEYPIPKPVFEPGVLFADAKGHIWAAGVHYLHRFDGEKVITYTAKDTEHLGNDHIYSFAATPEGEVWVGTEGGLFLYEDGDFVDQPREFSGTIFSMIYDLKGERLLFSTAWNGFYIKQGDKWTHYRLPYHINGRSDQMVRSISVEGDGTIWLATNSGAVRFSEKDRTWMKFGTEFTDGLIVGEEGMVFVDAKPRYVLLKKSSE